MSPLVSVNILPVVALFISVPARLFAFAVTFPLIEILPPVIVVPKVPPVKLTVPELVIPP